MANSDEMATSTLQMDRVCSSVFRKTKTGIRTTEAKAVGESGVHGMLLGIVRNVIAVEFVLSITRRLQIQRWRKHVLQVLASLTEQYFIRTHMVDCESSEYRFDSASSAKKMANGAFCTTDIDVLCPFTAAFTE